MSEARVPTSEPPSRQGGWSLETAIDYLLSVINEKHERVSETVERITTLINGNDKRYEERFGASQKALEVGFAAAKAAVDASFAAQKEAISAALAAQDRAVTKAELATEKRFESVNEFRGTLDNQQRTLIPRSEVDVLIRGLEEKISQLTKQFDQVQSEKRERRMEEKGVKDGWGWAAAVVALVLATITIIWRLSTP